MFKLSSRLGFGLEPSDQNRIFGFVTRQNLECHQLFKIGIARKINRSHATLTKFTLDLVFPERTQWLVDINGFGRGIGFGTHFDPPVLPLESSAMVFAQNCGRCWRFDSIFMGAFHGLIDRRKGFVGCVIVQSV